MEGVLSQVGDSERLLHEVLSEVRGAREPIVDFSSLVGQAQRGLAALRELLARLEDQLLEEGEGKGEGEGEGGERGTRWDLLEAHRQEWECLRSGLREAKMAYRRNMEVYARRQRAVVVGSRDEIVARRRKLAQQTAAQKEERVREGLVELRKLVRGGLGQAARMTAAAEESSQTLGMTLREWEEYGSEMDLGHVNISKLNARRRTDTVLITLAFVLYLGVVFFVLSKRLPDPVRNVLFSTANPLTWWAVFRDVARVVTGGSSAEALVGSTRDLQQPVHPPVTEL